eukprot:TRINITY_DN21070_c0_g1_i2.p1 TRINITY_DN21070_c0_g1~~TRINITY_DN21070_c0_g1_i2.p1  ORF type:complete len:457 (+),score=59.04 TRINITY_DN21070_c0_g1_i2:31-1401(+)
MLQSAQLRTRRHQQRLRELECSAPYRILCTTASIVAVARGQNVGIALLASQSYNLLPILPELSERFLSPRISGAVASVITACGKLWSFCDWWLNLEARICAFVISMAALRLSDCYTGSTTVQALLYFASQQCSFPLSQFVVREVDLFLHRRALGAQAQAFPRTAQGTSCLAIKAQFPAVLSSLPSPPAEVKEPLTLSFNKKDGADNREELIAEPATAWWSRAGKELYSELAKNYNLNKAIEAAVQHVPFTVVQLPALKITAISYVDRAAIADVNVIGNFGFGLSTEVVRKWLNFVFFPKLSLFGGIVGISSEDLLFQKGQAYGKFTIRIGEKEGCLEASAVPVFNPRTQRFHLRCLRGDAKDLPFLGGLVACAFSATWVWWLISALISLFMLRKRRSKSLASVTKKYSTILLDALQRTAPRAAFSLQDIDVRFRQVRFTDTGIQVNLPFAIRSLPT